jgi:lipid-binding SYLF domain-containing protein
VISIDNDANQAVYGEGVTPRRIFAGGVGNVPNAVVDFRDRLEEYTAR